MVNVTTSFRRKEKIPLGTGKDRSIFSILNFDWFNSEILLIIIIYLFIYYPLVQRGCGWDIGSVLYECMYVRTYVCSPIVNTLRLATSFIIQF